MANPHDKQIQVNDLEASISLLKLKKQEEEKNLRTVVGDLSLTEKKLKSLKDEIRIAIKELDSTIKKGSEFKKFLNEREEKLNKQESNLSQRELDLFSKQESFDLYIESKEKELANKLVRLEGDISVRVNDLKAVEANVEAQEAYYNQRNATLLEEINESKDIAEKERINLDDIQSDIKSEASKLEELQKETQAQEDKLNKTIEQNSTYKDELDRRERDVNRREADVMVWKRRLTKWAAEHFPNTRITF